MSTGSQTMPLWMRMLGEARSLAGPIASYWGSILIGFAIFSVLLMVFDDGDKAQNAMMLGALGISTLVPILVGQALALARFRTVWVISFAVAMWFLGWAVFIAEAMAIPTAADEVSIAGFIAFTLVFLILIGPFFLACGQWSLTTHMGLLSTFAPMVFIGASILIAAEKMGGADQWLAGNKNAVWNAITAPILALGVLLILAFLATRELHRLHRWRNNEAAPDIVYAAASSGLPQASSNPGCGGIGALILLGLILSVGTALTAPYLWRTGPDDDPDTSTTQQPSEPPPEPLDGTGDQRLQQMMQDMQEAAQQVISMMSMLLLVLVLTLIGLFVFGPPARRIILMSWLRRPWWPVPATRKVQHSWRVVEIALADAGVHREAGDTATSLVRRAIHLDLLDRDTLLVCAAVVDRVQHGLGVHQEDLALARRTAEMTYQTIWDELDERQKLVAMYRPL